MADKAKDFFGGMTKEQALNWLVELKSIQAKIYWTLFQANVGSRFHAFLEWNGLMAAHLNIASDMVYADEDPASENAHNGTSAVPEHRLKYFAEKLNCIFNGALDVRIVPPEERKKHQ